MTRPHLPDGYSARGATAADIADVARLLRAVGVAEGGRPGWTANDLENWWGNDYFEMDDDVVLVSSAATGELVGVEMVAHAPPYVLAVCIGGVHPAHCGRGLGTAMVRWALGRGRDRVPLAPEGALVEAQVYVFADHAPSAELLEGLDLSLDRYFLEMEIRFDGAPEVTAPPPGVTLRNFVPGEDDVAANRMMRDAFRDHYGYVTIGEEEGLRRFRRRLAHPEFDPRLWWLAETDGRLVGGVWTEPSNEGDETIGYVATLGVIRAWRGRGLGRALLEHSFGQLHAMGKQGAALGVDGDSLTGATRLYESAGMHQVAREAAYRMVLRDGVDLKTTSLE